MADEHAACCPTLPDAAAEASMERVAAMVGSTSAHLHFEAQHAWRCRAHPRVEREEPNSVRMSTTGARLDDPRLRFSLVPLGYLDCVVARLYSSEGAWFAVLTHDDGQRLRTIIDGAPTTSEPAGLLGAT
jgi:hypothetical protein